MDVVLLAENRTIQIYFSYLQMCLIFSILRHCIGPRAVVINQLVAKYFLKWISKFEEYL